jgi:hypothetical protein
MGFIEDPCEVEEDMVDLDDPFNRLSTVLTVVCVLPPLNILIAL